ncbi:TNF receptor-associated factor homolog 1b-like [Oryza brachyantha]|uniref:MATH domain-containing protein n=1 Tax=Oryza brachyantha TaxID=4533 RepID=J3M8Q6_ORYBR|nr:TNF receptor-associated factor homolog 1b-like [Oryza brachyantha]
MACAAATDDSAASTAGMRDEDRSLSGESLSEWRSCEQVESESPSTSPPFWDTDGDDDDPGPKPSDLFGRYTWRIENFSKEKKREMKSEPFEAGGYKWYILVYPQGCDVSNHLSLFLCVANHDKLLPGWSHFAQFTIAVGNIDPKKVKYSDTLHKFWKKEHDWGWKKFMELSKIQDGFLVDDVLEIIAQVQVIREKVDKPFRCLDRPYRRELLRVYTTNIESIYRRFVEERRNKLSKLIEDKMRWSSFCAFWSAIDTSTRHRMSREKTDVILKFLVKHFFVEKEVTSTLVMDSLYTGLKALEYQSKDKKGRMLAELDELPAPMIHVDMDMFVLASDVIDLLERAALEPLPCQPVSPKDDKCSQSRMKDGTSGEVNKISMEREERRLTELGRKILETFVLSHIFSGIEVAYQEAVALKRQEELIREEEEEAWLLGNETKGKRGGAVNEKDKRAKKKQAKQKKNNRKVKDKERDEKFEAKILERLHDETAIDDSDGLSSKRAEEVTTKVDTLEEGASDRQGDLDSSVTAPDKYPRQMNGLSDVASNASSVQKVKRDASLEVNSPAILADSVAASGIHSKGNNLSDSKNRMTPNRGKNQRNKGISIINFAEESEGIPSSSACGSARYSSSCGTAPKLDQDTVLLTLKDKLRKLGQRLHEKNIEGRKLLQAHFEAMEAKASGSSPSSSSLEEAPDIVKSPEQSPEVTTDAKANGIPNKDEPMTNHGREESVSVIPATKSTEALSGMTLPKTKVDPVSNKDHVPKPTLHTNRASINCSKSTPLDVEKDAPLPSRSPHINKAATVPPKSPQVGNATPAHPKSPPIEKACPAPPKSPIGAKDTSLPSVRSLQVDKPIPVPPRLPQVDKVASLSSELPQTSTAISEAQEETTAKRVTSPSVSDVAVTASRPSSAPVFPAPRPTQVQASTLLSRSMSEATRRSGNDPSPSAPAYIPQTYRNAIIGKHGRGTASAATTYQSTSLGQSASLSQPLSTYAPTMSVTMPPAVRNDQFSGRRGLESGLGKPEAHDSWQPWNGNRHVDKHLWRDDSTYQQTTNSHAYVNFLQARGTETESPIRFGGPQPPRQFQAEIPAGIILQQAQGAVAEEFPHLDIINDLLEEEQTNGSMPESIGHDYQTFGMPLPFLLRGNLADSEMGSASSPGRFNLAEPYYDEGFSRAYDMSAFQGTRERQFPSLDAYSNGLSDLSPSKPWLNGSPNPSMNHVVGTNGFPQQMPDYATNLASELNGGSLYHRRYANGRW